MNSWTRKCVRMVLPVLECLAMWFVASIPFSLVLGAMLARRDAPHKQAMQPRESDLVPATQPVVTVTGYEAAQ